MLDRILKKIGLIRVRLFLEWLKSRGGTLAELAIKVKALEMLGGAWSFTFTIKPDGNAEIHLLKVIMAPPVWRGNGFRKPTKDAPEEARVDRKAIYLGPVEDFPRWLESVKLELAADNLKAQAQAEEIQVSPRLEVVKGGKNEEPK